MIKNCLIRLIRIYQKIPGFWHKKCRFQPTCSEYMIGVINEFGVLKGLILGIRRIFRCNPFANGGYDPIPVNRRKLNGKN